MEQDEKVTLPLLVGNCPLCGASYQKAALDSREHECEPSERPFE